MAAKQGPAVLFCMPNRTARKTGALITGGSAAPAPKQSGHRQTSKESRRCFNLGGGGASPGPPHICGYSQLQLCVVRQDDGTEGERVRADGREENGRHVGVHHGAAGGHRVGCAARRRRQHHAVGLHLRAVATVAGRPSAPKPIALETGIFQKLQATAALLQSPRRLHARCHGTNAGRTPLMHTGNFH
jgi:hypothetical protein